MYVVNLQQQVNNKEIFNIRYLNNVRITFELIKSQPGVPICYRFQNLHQFHIYRFLLKSKANVNLQ